MTLYCANIGGNFSLYPPLVMHLFGARYSGSNYGIVFAMVNSATVLTIAIVSKCDLSIDVISKVLGGMSLLGVSSLIFLPNAPLDVVKKT